MIIEPAIRDNVCLNAHPVGCAAQVREQVDYVSREGELQGPRRVLIIGASNGYGLASRIVSMVACGADTVGVAFERAPRGKRTASAGHYNTLALEDMARDLGCGVWSINGDAFSQEIKDEVIATVREQMEQVDLVVYSIAAPRRQDPDTGELYSSVIRPIGDTYTAKTVSFLSGEIREITTPAATEDQVQQTVKVMGGEDWALWIETLMEAQVLAPNCLTVAFSYIGPEVTRAIYRDGTIGKAKEDLERYADRISQQLAPLGGQAVIGVMKALVTRASAVIPAVPLYISLLYKVMKAKGLHENCIQQVYRLYRDFLFTGQAIPVDEVGRIRLDDWEMRDDVQAEVATLWQQVTNDNITQLADIEGFRLAFYQHHGFDMPGVDYTSDVEP